jgi:hypothetical protein
VSGREQSPGVCALCGHRAVKGMMDRHLATCAPARDASEGEPAALFRLRVEAAGDPSYWLDVEVKAEARLRVLDRFLRDVWLECCGHLSAFTIGGVRYEVAVDSMRDFPADLFGGPRPRSMNARLHEAVTSRRAFRYEYDFGSTTELRLRMTAAREGRLGRRSLRLLARNEPPAWSCAICGGPAAQICVWCAEESENPFFCKDHASAHIEEAHDGDDGFLPVVNSPRMGVCGYTGPRSDRYEVRLR